MSPVAPQTFRQITVGDGISTGPGTARLCGPIRDRTITLLSPLFKAQRIR
jgi:phosphotransferase system IIA component